MVLQVLCEVLLESCVAEADWADIQAAADGVFFGVVVIAIAKVRGRAGLILLLLVLLVLMSGSRNTRLRSFGGEDDTVRVRRVVPGVEEEVSQHHLIDVPI